MESQNFQSVCAASSANKLIIISVGSLSLLSVSDVAKDEITSLSWNSDNQILILSSKNQSLWTTSSKSPSVFNSVARNVDQHLVKFFKSRSDHLISGGCNGVSMLWQLKATDLSPLRGFKHVTGAHSSAISTNGDDSLFAIGSHDNQMHSYVYLFDILDYQKPRNEYTLSQNDVPSKIEFSPHNKNHFGCSTTIGRFHLMDIQSNSPIITFTPDNKASPTGLNFMPHTRNEVLIPYTSGNVTIYDMLYRKTAESIYLPQEISSFTLLEDGVNFLIGTPKGWIYQYDLRNCKYAMDSINTQSSAVTSLCVQKGTPSFPNLIGYAHIYGDINKDVEVEAKTSIKSKRRAKDRSIEVSPFRRESVAHLKTNIMNLFTSPAGKKHKTSAAETKEISTQKCDTEAIFSHRNSITISHPEEIKATQLVQTPSKISSDTALTRSVKLKGVEREISDIPVEKGKESKPLEIDNNIYTLQEFIHDELRMVYFDILRQTVDQTIELRTHLDDTISNNNARERQLMEENIRLRQEVLLLRNLLDQKNKMDQNNDKKF